MWEESKKMKMIMSWVLSDVETPSLTLEKLSKNNKTN